MTTNKVIAAIDLTNCTDDQKGYYGIASAFRAFCYLDLARTYEFLDNKKVKSVEYQPPLRVATLHLDAVDRQPVSILNELNALIKEAPQVPGTKLD